MNLGNSKVCLVLGGAQSGKSLFAENLIIQSSRPRRYIATAQAWDSEMEEKIAAHQVQRGLGWTTCETPINIVDDIRAADQSEIILLDCITLWLTNLLMAKHSIERHSQLLLDTLINPPCPIVIVSNEVGQGIVPDNSMSRAFVKHQGNINQKLAEIAQQVIFITAGLPQILKGPK